MQTQRFTIKTDVELPEVGMTIDRYYNPTSITGSKKLSDSTLEWTIGYGLTTVHTGTGTKNSSRRSFRIKCRKIFCNLYGT
ncbi:hypothetical protein MGH68_02150 [Erysipelothrix sp. D19-032]